jgi:hypothetical protein
MVKSLNGTLEKSIKEVKMKSRMFLVSLLVLSIVGFLACSKSTAPTSPNIPEQSNPPTITSFSVSPTSVFFTETAILSWQTSGATQVEIESIGKVDNSGSTIVTTDHITAVNTYDRITYKITARNSSGAVTRECILEVEQTPILVFPNDPKPTYNFDGILLSYTGEVKNVGNATAYGSDWKVLITLYDSSGNRLSKDEKSGIGNTVNPKETNTWSFSYVFVSEVLRKKVDVRKTEFELVYPNWKRFVN